MNENEVKIIITPSNNILVYIGGRPFNENPLDLEEYHQIIIGMKDCYESAEEIVEDKKTKYSFVSAVSEETGKKMANDIIVEFQEYPTMERIYGKEFRNIVSYVRENTNKNTSEKELVSIKDKVSSKINDIKEKAKENKDKIRKVAIATGAAIGIVAIAAGTAAFLARDAKLNSENQYDGNKTKTSISSLFDWSADPADYGNHEYFNDPDGSIDRNNMTDEQIQALDEALKEDKDSSWQDLIPTDNLQSEYSGKGK